MIVRIVNNDKKEQVIVIKGHGYQTKEISKVIPANGKIELVQNLEKSFNWYDFSVKTKDNPTFEQRFAGRVETGLMGKTDPVMGRVV